MATFAAPYPSKSSWQLQLDVVEDALDAAGNRSHVSWALYIYRGSSDTPYNNSSSAFSVSAPGGVSSSFGAYRFGGTGSGTNYSGTGVGGRVLIASGGDWVAHNSDGTGSITVSASHAAAATLGTANIGASGFGLTTLTVAPGTPTGLTATRVSDTQTNLSWTNNNASNGAPTTSRVQQSVNGGSFGDVAALSATTSASVTTDVNRKTVYQVDAENSAGSSAYSATATIFTTPAAPTVVGAAKDSSANIVVSWTPQVAFSEHTHVVEHGTISGGVTTWDGSPLASVVAGTTSYTHATPNPSLVHVYRVSAKNTDTGALQSATVLSNSVQLLVAPNKPTLAPLPANVDKAAAFTVPWTHNSADTTPQTAYEFSYSTNGGSSWSSTGKVTSTTSSKVIAASTYAANTALTIRVRTWGQATSGGSDGTGASPWSDTQTVTFKTKPVVTITAPANSSTYTKSALTVALGFSQAESATFVSATIQLFQGATLLETKVTTTLSSTTLSTPVANGGSYSVKATVLDSNGVTSDQVTSAFTVAYTLPVPAVVTAVYQPLSGVVQLGLTIAAPGSGQTAAVTVSITRTINGVVETVVSNYPVSAVLTFLDTTPTIKGSNVYTVTTTSIDGATSTTVITLPVAERKWAFLSTGPGYGTVVAFFGNLKISSSPARESTLVKAAGRQRPIALYGAGATLDVNGSVTLLEGVGSGANDVEAFLLTAGKVCYRDPSGRRVFGALSGSIQDRGRQVSTFQFTVSESS